MHARTGQQLKQPLLPTLEVSVTPIFSHQFSSTAWKTHYAFSPVTILHPAPSTLWVPEHGACLFFLLCWLECRGCGLP